MIFGTLESNPTTIDSYIGKHLFELYKNCNENQLTAICPEFEVN